MGSLKFMVFFGSCREGRLGLPAGTFITNLIKAKNHDVFFFDPEEIELPVLKKPFHAYSKPEEAPESLRLMREHIVSSDAFIVIAPEYNHSMPPALLNALDHFHPDDYRHKPCGIVTYSYGSFGGVRAGIQLRSLAGELGMITPGFMVPIPSIHEAFSKDGKPLNESVEKNGKKLVQEMEWYAHALKNQREKVGNPS